MAGKRVIAICQSGGEFETDKDGFLSYKGGDAHAMEMDDKMNYNDFKMEVAEMFNFSLATMSVKYFLPGNRKTLITISNDKDLKRMIKFHGDSDSAEIYVMTEEAVDPDFSNMHGSRSSRTTLSEMAIPVDAPLSVVEDIVDDPNEPGLLLDANFDVVSDTNNIDDSIGIEAEMPVPVSFVATNYDEKNAKAAQQWQNDITGVGQRFNSVHEFRETLRKYAIANQFAFKYKKNDSHRVTVKCKAEGCPWRIHASRLSTTQLICIKKMNPTHTCEGAVVTNGYQATRSWVASIIKEKLKVFPNYKPKDIVNDIQKEYGIQLNYFQAWRGKEIAKEQLQGSYKEAYSQLPFFCEKVMETNPGSLATFTTKDDSSFHRLFVSFHASLYGFEQGCRPLIFLDSIFLKSKYQGTLLAATAADGNDGVFPVAFAIVDAESDDNWSWFLLQLRTALSMCRGITFVADREKGLRESIAEIFQGEDVFHGYCLRYLSEQLIRDVRGQFSHEVKRLLVEDFYGAAYASKPEGFHRCADSIKSISVDAYNWVMQSEPNNWANAFFRGMRYNHMTSNFGELFYGWVSDAHDLPITQMVDAIRGKIMELIYTRRTESNQWVTRLTPSMEERLEKESLNISSLQVLTSSGTKFEVRGDTIEFVDVDHCDCSCRGWQLTGLPCCHAIAVMVCLGRDPYDYCARYFTADSYRSTYSESIHPIPSLERPKKKDASQAAVTVNPPPTRRPPGRPTTKKVGSHEVTRRQLQCSRCKGTGHNKSTCKEVLLES
ncbi:uncharacterized protein [Nicotiana tomentosiformis]|uniref:uncharacterized protein n=1 Tax=Nicotiana tomentosiformis TaxID=4098 RepID=UPI00051C1665|nr:uncharacterized protein LOC104095672 [Nicotiana tomentosiformis]XP_009600142.1 uncharacterized protein LOC104095672 [Nicotiana tomentosiformis]